MKIKPQTILWYSKSVAAPTFMRGLASDQCVFDGRTVMLSKALKERLSPSEWKSLLASELIYEFRSSRKIIVRWLSSIVLVVLWAFVALALAGGYDGFGLALALTIAIPNTMTATWLFSRGLRRVRLDADEKAARLVGPIEFLEVLEKVDSYGIKDVEMRKRGGFQVEISSHFPAINSRVERVRKLTG